MKRAFITGLLVAMCGIAAAQDVYSRFYDALKASDSTALANTIGEIRASGDQSADRYVAEYNYYISRAQRYSGMMTTKEYPDENVHVVGNVYTLNDSLGNEAGYMYFVEDWDEAVADTGLAVIDTGIAHYPHRLDMRFGKLHMLRTLWRWDAYAAEIHATLDYAAKNKKMMEFPDTDTPIDTILIESILDYERDLFEAVQYAPDSITFAKRLDLLRGIAEHMLSIYPKDMYSLNIMAVTRQLVGDHEGALKWFLKAEKAAPKDAVVLSNIADTYHLLGDYKKESKYLQKVVKYDNGEYAERAKQNLEELNNQH